jgi:hypothetical protein
VFFSSKNTDITNQELPMDETLSPDERAELEQLRKEKAARGKGDLYLKVSEKGGVSLYGMGRFPVTLYKEQWEKVIANMDMIKNFIKDHESELKTKE